MTVKAHTLSQKAARDFKAAVKTPTTPKRAKRSDVSPLVIRVTAEECERLNELATGMTLSAYVRACVFGQEAKRRKRRPKDAVEDKKAAAEALALLGQSRIANNLNQLAYHANIGALDIGEAERAQIEDAYAHVLAIRAFLLQALGKPQRQASDNEADVPSASQERSQQGHLAFQGDTK